MGKKIYAISMFLISLFFSAVNVLGQSDGFPEVHYYESIVVNPAYRNDFSVGDLEYLIALAGERNVTKAVYSAYTPEQMAAAIKKSLKNYEEEFTISFYSKTVLTDAQLDAIYDSALEHTGVPDEGEYIRWNQIGRQTGWIGPYSSSSGYRYDITYRPVYAQTKAQEQEVSSRVESVLASLNLGGKTTVEKIRAIYDFIIAHNSYDNSAVGGNDPYPHSTHAALIAQRSVCQGYATLFYRLLLMAGIDNRIANSTNHAWNIVRVGSKYYHTDCTWGDTTGLPEEFFLRSSANIRKYDQYSGGDSHVLDSESAARLAGYPISDVDYSEESGEDEVLPTAIILSPSEQTIPVGSDFLLNVQFLPENTTNTDVILSFSDESVAAYGSDIYPMDKGYGYWVIGTSAGTTVITATSAADPSVKATCAVTVTAPKLVVSSVTAMPGDEVEVGVSIVDNEGIDFFSFDFAGPDYDKTRLSYLGFEPSGFTNWDGNEWYHSSDDRAYNGEILRLKFKVPENAPEGDAVVTLPNCRMTCYYFGPKNNWPEPGFINFIPEIEAGKVTVAPSAALQGILSVSSVEAMPGDEVEVSISIAENPGIQYLDFYMDYDQTRLSCLGFEPVGFINTWETFPDFSLFAWSGQGGITTYNGEILRLKFKVLNNAPEGDAVVTLKNCKMSSWSTGGYTPEIRPGKVTVHSPETSQGILMVSASPTEIRPGNDVVVYISIADCPGIDSLIFDLDYDQTRLSYIGFDGILIDEWETLPNFTRFIWTGSNTTYLGGDILGLKFKVLDNAPEGDAFVTLKNCLMGDSGSKYYYPEIQPGNVTVVLPSAEDGILSVFSVRAKQGEEVEVGVSIANNPGINNLSFGLDYDQTRLSFIGFVDSGFNGWEYSDDGELSWYGEIGSNNLYNGEIVRLKFKVLDNAPEGDAFITLTNCNMRNVRWVPKEVDRIWYIYYFPEIVPGKVTVASPAAAQGILSVSSAAAKAGDEVKVGISIAENPGIVALTLGFNYDHTRLSYIGFENSGFTGWTVTDSQMAWIDSEDNFYNGEIVRLKFKVLDNAPEGDALITLICEDGDMADSHESSYIPTIEAGKVKVVNYIPGDMNGDGKVNALDLIRLKRYLGGEDVVLHANGDVNNDGKTNALDLIRLKRFLGGENVEIH